MWQRIMLSSSLGEMVIGLIPWWFLHEALASNKKIGVIIDWHHISGICSLDRIDPNSFITSMLTLHHRPQGTQFPKDLHFGFGAGT